MIISTENDNFSLTILLPGKETPSSSNVNICVVDSNDDVAAAIKRSKNSNNISTMMVTCSGTLLPDSKDYSRRSASASPYPYLSVHRKDFESMEHHSNLLQGLNQLREKGQLLDVTLWAENRPFQAHRAVLAACSDYFRAMFTDPMRERLQADIYLAGVSAKGLSLVLEYVYTSRISLSLQNIHSVLSAASHLQVLQVLEACSSYLHAQLDSANCVDILDLSETFGLNRLIHSSYRFVSESLSSISPSQLLTLSGAQMERLLSADFPVDVAEVDILDLVLTWISKDEDRTGKMSQRLLRRINFSEISSDEIRSLVERHLADANLSKSFLTKVLSLKSDAENASSCDMRSKSRGLINFRGMELAMIKVGGFGAHGVTNQLSYFFAGAIESGKWFHLTRVPHLECSNFGCAVVDNELYVVGGCFNQTQSLANFQEQAHPFGFRYNPRQDQWSSIAPMLRERCRFSLTSVGQVLYAVGGSGGSSDDLENFDADGHQAIEDVTGEEYDILEDIWRPLPALPGGPRTQHASVGCQGKFLLVSGGLDRHHEVLDSMLVYDVTTRTWEPLGWRRMPTPRADHVMLEYNNRIFVIGGWCYDNGDRDGRRSLVVNVDSYDIACDVWSVETQVPRPKFHAGIAIVRDKLYIVGGCLSDILFDRTSGSVECYDLIERQWREDPGYPQDIWEHVCLPLYVPKGREDQEIVSA